MAKPRVFVSSTCYDLGLLRSELRPFIAGMGYEPIMSEYSDVLYDPRSHTHTSCINEVANCDLLILILGQRFGGAATESALENFDFDALSKESSSSAIFESNNKLSITQLEVLKAIQACIPIYAFVDEKVYHDHLVYEKNKGDSELVGRIQFPSIQKNETARYIFEFINFMTHRVQNNSIIPFARLDDIRVNLISQWSQLYQRLLHESRTRASDVKSYQNFSERLEDLKAVVLASITTPNLRDIAKGAVQFRHLVTFVCALQIEDHLSVLKSSISWGDLLATAKITEIKTVEGGGMFDRSSTYFIVEDGTFYKARFNTSYFEHLEREWGDFSKLQAETRKAISEALVEDIEDKRRLPIVYMAMQLGEYLDSLKEEKVTLTAAYVG